MDTGSLHDLDRATRWRLHLIPLVAVLFLSIYGKVVCPFIDTITLAQVMGGLSLVGAIQIALREAWWHLVDWRRWPATAARQGFYLSVSSWLAAGLVAVMVHAIFYRDFPFSSHLKLLSGYWALGGGILSQVEYVALERHFRRGKAEPPEATLERITRRLMEGFAVVAVVPSVIMVLMAFRNVFEGYAQRGVVIEVGFLGVCFAAAALFLSWRYGIALREDCNGLRGALASVKEGRFDLRIDSSRADELGLVARGINDMAAGLALRERIREAFGRFVEPAVAEAFIRDYASSDCQIRMGGSRREVVVLMADLRDFTPLSESLEPEALTELLNAYFSEMVAALRGHGGMIDKFIGDAVMAVFGLTESGEGVNYAESAVNAALDMRARLEVFNQAQAQNGGPILRNGIGIHQGTVVAGYIGSPDRLEFTVIGRTVNLAARIESQAKPPNPPILFSQAIAERLSGSVIEVASAELKGVAGRTTLYTVGAREAT